MFFTNKKLSALSVTFFKKEKRKKTPQKNVILKVFQRAFISCWVYFFLALFFLPLFLAEIKLNEKSGQKRKKAFRKIRKRNNKNEKTKKKQKLKK